jgi:hypothetical protein
VSVPYVGAVVAAVTVAAAIRRKGMTGGLLETALNATPIVGAAKNLVEIFRGDLIPDRRREVR